jgi:hypothetical protein
MDAEQVLAAAGFESPEVEMQIADGPLQRNEPWSRIVSVTGSAEQVEHWIEANFEEGMDSRAHRDDQDRGRAARGGRAEGGRPARERHERPRRFVVVVGQQAEPTVHVAMRRTGR